MLRFYNTQVVFQEVPDEISLAVNITGCPIHCPGCHSTFLWDDAGVMLSEDSLTTLIESNEGITCVAFMGGDREPEEILRLSAYVKTKFGLKVCWYSGRELEEVKPYISNLDYLKVGPYVEELGGMDSPKTNQRFYILSEGKIVTSKNFN